MVRDRPANLGFLLHADAFAPVNVREYGRWGRPAPHSPSMVHRVGVIWCTWTWQTPRGSGVIELLVRYSEGGDLSTPELPLDFESFLMWYNMSSSKFAGKNLNLSVRSGVEGAALIWRR